MKSSVNLDLSRVSNQELISGVLGLRGEEREMVLSILYHLQEIDTRRLYAELGYSSLYDYCVRALKYSEASAYRRITAARCIKENQSLADLFLRGEVSLTSIAMASKGIKEASIAIEDIAGKSKREVEVLVVAELPQSAQKPERVKPIVVEREVLPLFAAKTAPKEPAEERYQISFLVSKETYEQYETARNKLSNTLGGSLTVERVFETLLGRFLKPQERTSKASSTDSRYISKHLKRAIFKRDQGQCTYVAPNGVRCNERRYLQIDHIIPFALGGETTLSNLRLYCSCHNQYAARKVFGELVTFTGEGRNH
jgi:hypothetical protein